MSLVRITLITIYIVRAAEQPHHQRSRTVAQGGQAEERATVPLNIRSEGTGL